MKTYLKLLAIIFLLFTTLLCKPDISNRGLNKTNTLRDKIILNANNISCPFYNNGIWAYNIEKGNWGMEWPKGSGKSPLFAAGILLGAKVDGEVRGALISYAYTDYQPGIIDNSHQATDPKDPVYKFYKIDKNDINNWNDVVWPANQGAPYTEDGEPLLIGDQTIFSVFNDLTQEKLADEKSLGAEIQQTAWAFNFLSPYDVMIFIKWRIVNKSSNNWDSTFVSVMFDPDIGHVGDDLVGCDTTLDLAYCYNGHATDYQYGKNPRSRCKNITRSIS